jgi:NDP-sugar pyrophosphorylase family protein
MNPANYQVVIIAGGYGKGLMHRTLNKIPKCLLEVEGKVLLDHCIELYLQNGFKNFVLLLGHLGQKVIEHVEKNWQNEKIKFSVEEKALGKGGAIKFALDKNVIERSKPSIICYPDDVILKKDFPRNFVNFHERKREEGAIATAACVSRVRLRYGVFKIDEKNFAVSFEEKPWIEQMINVGSYVIQPEVYDIVDNLIDLQKAPADFESIVIKEIAKMKKLACFELSPEEWISFNDEKEFEDGVRKIKMLKISNCSY